MIIKQLSWYILDRWSSHVEYIVSTMLQVISFAFLYKHVFQIGFKWVQLLQAQYIESMLI